MGVGVPRLLRRSLSLWSTWAERRARLERARSGDAAAGDEHRKASVTDGDFAGLLFIDGERADPARLRSLAPETIERVEVLKGVAAAQQYDAPEAKNGAIHIYTKDGGGS